MKQKRNDLRFYKGNSKAKMTANKSSQNKINYKLKP